MQTQNSNGRQILLGTDIKNLSSETLSVLTVQRHAKSYVDTLRKSAIIRPFSFYRMPTVSGAYIT